jgi:hypothetical protein
MSRLNRRRCDVRFLKFLPFIVIGGLMMLHGFAHLPGVLGSWELATFDDVSRQPNVLLTDAGDGLLFVLGAFWLLAAASFVVAGIGVLRQANWWPMAAAIAIVVSLPITLLWKDDAVAGLALNTVLLVTLFVWFMFTSIQERRIA